MQAIETFLNPLTTLSKILILQLTMIFAVVGIVNLTKVMVWFVAISFRTRVVILSVFGLFATGWLMYDIFIR
jgi:hypothetical protein